MNLSKGQKIGIGAVAALVVIALGLGIIFLVRDNSNKKTASAATTSTSAAATKNDSGNTNNTTATTRGNGASTSSTTSTTQPGRIVDPVRDFTAPTLQITDVNCISGRMKVYFAAADPSGIKTITEQFVATDASGNPVSFGGPYLTKLSSDTYVVEVDGVPGKTNKITINVTDNAGNTATTSRSNICI